MSQKTFLVLFQKNVSSKPKRMSHQNLFSLVPKRGTSVGDIGKADAANLLICHSAHEQKLVTPPGIKR